MNYYSQISLSLPNSKSLLTFINYKTNDNSFDEKVARKRPNFRIRFRPCLVIPIETVSPGDLWDPMIKRAIE